MLAFIVISAAFWCVTVAWFALVQKPLFGLYNHRESATPVSSGDWIAIMRNGIRSDMIIASYLTAVPLLILSAGEICGGAWINFALVVYEIAISIAVGLISVADTLLYRFWKYKIDNSVFAYMRSMKGATASVSTTYLLAAVATWLATSATLFAAVHGTTQFVMHIVSYPPDRPWQWWSYLCIVAATLVALGLLFLIIRGTGIRPNSPSIAFFSANPLLNHWALNPAYSLIYSLSRSMGPVEQFKTMPQDECENIFNQYFPQAQPAERKLLRTERPNILLVIWESFGAEFSGAFGGRSDVCTNFDRISSQGVCFTRCTAGSFRTDRGLVNLLSGYPAQPTMSVIQHTRKLPALPGLPRTLAAAGYTTEAIHGGDLSIMNKNDYYLASGHKRLLDQRNFPADAPKGKWGVHDDASMQLATDEAIRLTAEGKPFMITLQTLSSHEPFDVPQTLLADKQLNSFAYTDMALGHMVDKLKASAAWDNLLLIVVADHGFNASMLPDNRLNYAHIPLLMTGGAVASPARIDTIMSQTDLAATLLSQMNLPHDDFIFSHDILSADYGEPFALHIFNNGIMIVDDQGHTVRDTMLDKTVDGTDDDRRIRLSRAILQKIYSDLNKR